MIVRIVCFAIILFVGMSFSTVFCQDNSNDLDKFLTKVGQEQAGKYLQPLVTGLGMSMNADLYHTAATHAPGGFDITLKAMAAMVPTGQRTFVANLPPQTLIVAGHQVQVPARSEEWSTICGPKRPAGLPDQNLNPGGLDFDLVPFAVPQISVGLPGSIDLMARFMSFKVPDVGKIKVFGFGGKHNLKHHIKAPLFPDLSVQAFYQTFSVGDLVDAKSWAVDLHVSKSMPILIGYAGIGFEGTTFDYDYTITNSVLQTSGTRVTGSIDGENTFRFVAGARIKITVITLNGSINIGKYTTYSGGIGFTFR